MYSGIISITDLIVKEGLINLDLADVRTVLGGMGRAMLGMGEAAGEQRATVAAEEALVNPLLDDVTLKGAKSLLLCITGGRDMTLWEVEEAASRVCQEVDPDANIIVGATFDEGLGDRIRVSIVASGMPRLAVEMPIRHIEGPTWTPRAQRDPDGAASDGFGRRLTEAIGDGEMPSRSRASQRSRTRNGRAPNEVESKKDGAPKLPKQPSAARPRKASTRKTPPPLSQVAVHAPVLPAEIEDLDSKRRMRRARLDDAPVLPPRWPDRPLPEPNRVLEEPLIPPQPAVTLRHDPQPLPRKTGFLERLGFGRMRREA
jgi:cell division protein FtsZ